MNKTISLGNLTRDPETRFSQTGTPICTFGIAMNERFTQNGEKKDRVTFVEVTAFGKTAETIAQYFKKGQRILIEGRLQLDQWEDKNGGGKRSKLFIVVENFSFIERAESGGNAAPRTSPPPATRPPVATGPISGQVDAPPVEEDDVPF